MRLESTCDDAVRDLRDRVARASEQQTHDRDELTHVLRKCLDTQHLLSATVVALQSEVDESATSNQPSDDASGQQLEQLTAVVDDVRENQRALTDALRVMQQCVQSVQHESVESCRVLGTRLESTEETFVRLADDALTHADDLVRLLESDTTQMTRQRVFLSRSLSLMCASCHYAAYEDAHCT